MIRSIAHATAVQKRRAAAGKTGYAKAVVRWANRTGRRNSLATLPMNPWVPGFGASLS